MGRPHDPPLEINFISLFNTHLALSGHIFGYHIGEGLLSAPSGRG